MLYLFAGLALGLALATLRDEFRPGGMLDWRGLVEDAPDVAVLIDLPRSDGWTDDDVIKTYAEIQAL